MNKDSYVYTIVFTFVLTAFFATILAVTQAYFLPAITENETKVERKAILKVLGLPEDALPTFDEQVVPALASDLNIYATLDADGEPLGYAFPLDGQGLWDRSGYIGISAEFDRLLGLEFIEQNETPKPGRQSMKPGTKSSLQGTAGARPGDRLRRRAGQYYRCKQFNAVLGILNATIEKS